MARLTDARDTLRRGARPAFDVLVVGSGAGALVGAYTAMREGLSVLLVESTNRYGGTTAYSGGGMWMPTSRVLREAGFVDSAEDAARYFHAVVGDGSPRAMQTAFLETGPQLVDYLLADPNGLLRFMPYPWADYYGEVAGASEAGHRHVVPQPIARASLGPWDAVVRETLAESRGESKAQTVTGGRALVSRLLLAMARLGQRTGPDEAEDLARLPGAAGAPAYQPGACGALALQREATLTSLEHDGERVTGASLATPRGTLQVEVRRGVLLAAGGFERSAALRARFGVPGRAIDTMSPEGNLGLAHLAALELGADMAHASEAWWAPGLLHPDGRATFSLLFHGGIFVDGAGRRFVNESWPYDRVGRVVLEAQAAGRLSLPYFMVYDDRTAGVPPVGSASVPLAPAEAYRAAGLWRTAPTLPALAACIGVSADALVATVERWNRMVAAGLDADFGRGVHGYDRMMGGLSRCLVPIERGPFHAAAFGLSDLGTKGGLVTDVDGLVQHASGGPIPGLYAAGNTMAPVSGRTYPGGGNPIGASMVFGHRAARAMARVAGGG